MNCDTDAPNFFTMAPTYRGDHTKSLEVTISVNGAPLDLTGASARATFKSRTKSGSQWYQATVGNGITLTDPTNGVLTLDRFPVPNTVEIASHPYDIEVTASDSIIRTVLEGVLQVLEDVSNP